MLFRSPGFHAVKKIFTIMSSLRKVKINTFQQYSHPVIIALTKYLICVIRVIRGFRSGFIMFILAFFAIAAAQNDGTVRGIVIDDETKSPSIGANVLIKDTFWGAATDENGEFNINHIPFGKYTITITVIGYKPYEETLVVSPENPVVRVSAMLKREVIPSSQIVVTASRSEQNIMDLPLSVSLVSQRKIMEKNVISLEKALMYEPGVTVIKNQLNIRGASGYTMGAGSRSLLLLDGLPLMGSASGNITWDVIPVSEIDRVEIVKSGGSAMYGSGAMGGVVNIITRNAPPKPRSEEHTSELQSH